VLFESLTSDQARAALRADWIDVDPATVAVERREQRWLVSISAGRLAWFAASPEGLRLLALERRVLALLAERCTFPVPRVIHVAQHHGFDVRIPVSGSCEPWSIYERAVRDPAVARRVGEGIGRILAEQHLRVAASDVVGWLPDRVAWPERSGWIAERLPRVVEDPGLIERVGGLIERYEALPIADRDRVLVHGDVGFHNLALDPETWSVRGIFDYEAAAWADRHHDFRNLLFHEDRTDLLEAALAVYEAATGTTLSRRRIALYNAALAATYLAYRGGMSPDTVSCGRTLAQDLRWTRGAIDRLDAMDATHR